MLLVYDMELSVGEMSQILGQSQPRVSRHIRILSEAGLLERRKEGSWVFMRLGPAARMPPLRQLLFTDGAVLPFAARDRAKLIEVRQESARQAESWFEAHAAEWDCMRSLHVAEGEVESMITAMLAGRAFNRMMDVGTGTGRMIELLGGQARHVLALDRSPAMLRLARSKLDRTPSSVGNPVDFLLGDFQELPVEDATCDLLVYHQVLHYAQFPERVVGEAARVLAPGGQVLIVDFAAHDREELRSRHAHARLGFDDKAMEHWMALAGIALERVEQVNGGALTVKLWLGRRRD